MATIINLARNVQLPETVKRPPLHRPNKLVRTREYLTNDEIDRLIAGVPRGRNTERDRLLILIGYRHGLRVGEVTRLQWSQIDLKAGLLHVVRLKHGRPSTHPIYGDEIRQLRAWQRKQGAGHRYVFDSWNGPLTSNAVHKIVAAAGRNANLGMPIHPHMLRHSCGFYLANRGTDTRTIQQYLGHSNIANTVIYTELAPNRFNNLFDG